MLVLVGILVICGLQAAILLNRLSPIAALILTPVAGALATGFGVETAGFMVAGISDIAPVAGLYTCPKRPDRPDDGCPPTKCRISATSAAVMLAS